MAMRPCPLHPPRHLVPITYSICNRRPRAGGGPAQNQRIPAFAGGTPRIEADGYPASRCQRQVVTHFEADGPQPCSPKGNNIISETYGKEARKIGFRL